MNHPTHFKATYNGQSYDFKTQRQHFKLQIKDAQSQRITIDIAVISGEQLVTYRDPDIGNTEYYDTIGLFIEHLQIPCSFIKEKNFRSLQEVNINYQQDWALDPHPMLTPTSDIIGVITSQLRPSGDYITSLKAHFKHLSHGLFLISLEGTTDDKDHEAISDFSLKFPANLEIEVWDVESNSDLRDLFTRYFHEQDFEISILLSDAGIQQILTATVKDSITQ